MDKETAVKYWLDTAEQDYQTVEHLFVAGDYHWALFVGHLVIEKLLKGLFVKRFGGISPRIHDLPRLAEKCDLTLDDKMLDKLDLITRFNIGVRYPDYQQEMYKICTKEFSLKVLDNIKEIKAWLQELIKAS